MQYGIIGRKDILSRSIEDVREETFFCYKSIYEGCREEETGNNSSFEIELTTVKFKFDSIKNRM